MITYLTLIALDTPFNDKEHCIEQFYPGDEICALSIDKTSLFRHEDFKYLEVKTDKNFSYFISEESFKNKYICKSDYSE
jgi:hypothetical protein